MYTADQLTPMPGWLLCKMMKPVAETSSGLVLARPEGLEDGKTTEGVAEVLRVTPPRKFQGEFPIKVGDRIIIRDFLKAANALGNMMGEDRNDRVFLLDHRDAFAVVEGPGTVGHYGEFRLE